jgi:hypothetical protein
LKKEHRQKSESQAQKLRDTQLDAVLKVQKAKSDAALQVQQSKSDAVHQIQQVADDLQQALSLIAFHKEQIERLKEEASSQEQDGIRLMNDMKRDRDEKVKAEAERGDDRVEMALLRAALYDRYVFSRRF